MDYFEHLQRHSAEFFRKILDHGIITREEDLQLCEGLLIYRVPRSIACVAAADRLGDALYGAPRCSALRQEELTFALAKPESVVRPDWTVRSASGEPAVTIDLGDQLLDVYRRGSGRVFARAEVPQFWFVNLIDRRVEVFSSPTGPIDQPHYAQRELYYFGSSVPLVIDGQTVGTIAVADVMA